MGVDEAEARLILALRGASQDVKLTVLEAALSATRSLPRGIPPGEQSRPDPQGPSFGEI